MSLSGKVDSEKIKLNSRRLSEIICEELTGWIMDGTLERGQRIREEELAETFGVSRIPVREALRVLNTRGLVETKPYVGTRVSKLSKKDIKEIYFLRSVLEPIACERAAELVTDEDINALVEIQNILEEVCTQDKDHLSYAKTVYQYNREFHMGIYRLSQMDHMIKILEDLWHSIAFLRLRAANSANYAEQMKREHHSYLNYLQKRDGKGLAEELKNNLTNHLDAMMKKTEK